MNLESVIDKLEKESREMNRRSKISTYEKSLSEDIDVISGVEKFYQLPIKNIFSILEKADLSIIDISTIQKIIQSTIKYHRTENETILLLQVIKNDICCSYSMDECMQIIQTFTNNDFLMKISNLYQEEQHLGVIDYEYELVQKDKEIKELKAKVIKQKNTIDEFENCFNKVKDQEKKIKEHVQLINKNYNELKTELEEQKKNSSTSSQFNAKNPSYSSYIPHKFEKFEIMKASPSDKTTNNMDKSIINADSQRVQYLIENGKMDKNMRFNGNWTPLHYACKQNNLYLVRYLCEYQKADKEAQTGLLERPLHCACDSKAIIIVDYLINYQNVFIEPTTNLGWTPLLCACKSGDIDVVILLHNKGANFLAKTKDGLNALHIACIYNHVNIAKFLIEVKRMNIEERTNKGETPLIAATDLNNKEIVKYLISKNANTKATRNDGKRAYDLCWSSDLKAFLK